MTLVKFLKRVINKLITLGNSFPLRNLRFVLDAQMNYVKYIIVSRDIVNTGMRRKEVIQVISNIGQVDYCVQLENHLDYLI